MAKLSDSWTQSGSDFCFFMRATPLGCGIIELPCYIHTLLLWHTHGDARPLYTSTEWAQNPGLFSSVSNLG